MSATLPDPPLTDKQAVFDWYGPGNGSSGLVCPICFTMVPFLIDPARGHLDWHARHQI